MDAIPITGATQTYFENISPGNLIFITPQKMAAQSLYNSIKTI